MYFVLFVLFLLIFALFWSLIDIYLSVPIFFASALFFPCKALRTGAFPEVVCTSGRIAKLVGSHRQKMNISRIQCSICI